MLGVVGYLVSEAGIRLPGDISYDGTKFADIPAGFDALTSIPQFGLIQIVAFIGALELGVMKDVTGAGEFPGDFRNGALDFGWDLFTEEQKFQKRAIELNQGRAAQMGVSKYTILCIVEHVLFVDFVALLDFLSNPLCLFLILSLSLSNPLLNERTISLERTNAAASPHGSRETWCVCPPRRRCPLILLPK